MKQTNLTVKTNLKLTDGVYELKLTGDVGKLFPGQFIEIALTGFYLRRPFGVCDCTENELTVLYRVQGRGTEYMTSLKKGDAVNCLLGLGNGFRLDAEKPLIIGGGMGIAPLYYLAKYFDGKGKRPLAVLGFKNKSEAFYVGQFEKYADVTVATDDGSLGFKGNVLDALKALNADYGFYYACGPEIMLKKLSEYDARGELSLEARMGCGFGACMGCSIQTTDGVKRVCREGPVFSAGEVLF